MTSNPRSTKAAVTAHAATGASTLACRAARRNAAARGAAAETIAADYLQAQGLTLIARNLRCKAGELDIVCIDADVLVIVEVRLRSRTDYGGALASITMSKQRKIVRATRFFWQRHGAWQARTLRFDVIALQSGPQTAPTIEWVRDAFREAR